MCVLEPSILGSRRGPAGRSPACPWLGARLRTVIPSGAMDRIECQWCKSQNDAGQTTCATCGAPLDARNLVSDSGWKEAPRLKDMTEFRFSNSTCQVEGELVPVAESTWARATGCSSSTTCCSGRTRARRCPPCPRAAA